MMYLLLSIVFSVVAVSFFKLFEIYKVNTFQAIVVNYLTCVVVGNLFSTTPIISYSFWLEPWFVYCVILGMVFISVFYAIGLTTQKMGVSVSMVAAKLSVVIPILMAWLIHNEPLSVVTVFGILLSLVAVYFISKKVTGVKASLQIWFLPIYVFVGSGIIDSTLKVMQLKFIPPASADDMLTAIFLVAFCIGGLVLLYKRESIKLRSVLWGISLGIPNYFCMYFLVKALEVFKATVLFPINNIAIVMCATLVSILFFNEKLSKLNWVGFVLAICSIIMLAFANVF